MTLKNDMPGELAVLLNTDEFAEAVVYVPYGEAERTINAIVDRNPTQEFDEDGAQHFSPRVEITIANHATLGVTKVNKGRDEVRLFKQLGDTLVTTFRVREIMDQDEGAWRLDLQI